MWQDGYLEGKIAKKRIEEAIKYCKKLGFAGYSDWRLPTVDEVKEIYKIRDDFGVVSDSCYWTSSKKSSNFLVFDFYDGYDFEGEPNYSYSIRCVR
jgi:hypothetical protein